jgi:hypothetical protein
MWRICRKRQNPSNFELLEPCLIGPVSPDSRMSVSCHDILTTGALFALDLFPL